MSIFEGFRREREKEGKFLYVLLIDGLVTSGKSAARVSTHDLIELIDEPD